MVILSGYHPKPAVVTPRIVLMFQSQWFDAAVRTSTELIETSALALA